jgi:peptide/nickel transport system permease protein
MRYYIKRFGQTILTLWIAATLAFLMYRLMPGNPVDAYKAELLRQAAESNMPIQTELLNERIERRMNIDPGKPLADQYIDYWADIILEQDFGRSIQYQEPVFDVLFRAMPWSVLVSVYGMLLGFSVSIFLGALQAYKEGTKFDYGVTLWTLITGSIPYYVAAIFMLSFLGFKWGIFPTGGRYDTSLTPDFTLRFFTSVLRHAALPVLSGFILSIGGALGLRGNAIRIVGSNYLKSARIRGIGTGRIATRYVLRNAMLPLYIGVLMGISGIFSGSIIVEWIFNYAGVGWYMYNALILRDCPLLMGAFLFYSTLTVLGILVADLTYGLIDPRVRGGESRESF